MNLVVDFLATLRQTGARLAPYVLMELLLPGGTLIALLLFLYRRAKAGAGNYAAPPACRPVLVSAACPPAQGRAKRRLAA